MNDLSSLSSTNEVLSNTRSLRSSHCSASFIFPVMTHDSENRRSSVQDLRRKSISTLSAWGKMKLKWNRFKSSSQLHNMQTLLMAFVSILDHFTDYYIMMKWIIYGGVSPFICIIGMFAIFTTTLFPVCLYDEWYIKITMPLGLGILSLIYRFYKDPTSTERLRYYIHLREQLGVAKIQRRHDPVLSYQTLLEYNQIEPIALDEPQEALQNLFNYVTQLSLQSPSFEESQNEAKRIGSIDQNLIRGADARTMAAFKSHVNDLKRLLFAAHSVTSMSILTFFAPATYKAMEVMFESIPQIVLQLYVALAITDNSIEQDWELYFSISVSILANAYAGTMMLYPQGLRQALLTFALCFFDLLFRAGGMLYLLICTPVWIRLILLLTNITGSALCLIRLIKTEQNIRITMLFLIFTLTFSGTTTFFVCTGGLNKGFDKMSSFFNVEVPFRLFITALSLVLGTLFAGFTFIRFFIIILISAIIVLLLGTQHDTKLFPFKTAPRDEFIKVTFDIILDYYDPYVCFLFWMAFELLLLRAYAEGLIIGSTLLSISIFSIGCYCISWIAAIPVDFPVTASEEKSVSTSDEDSEIQDYESNNLQIEIQPTWSVVSDV